MLIGDIIRKHGLTFHHYADDLQIFAHFEYNDQSLYVCLETGLKNYTVIYLQITTDQRHQNEVNKVCCRTSSKRHGTNSIDYCNSLLYGISGLSLMRIQRIQHTTAILILQRDRWSSARVMLNELHWLPMRKRISFKVLPVLYKAMHGLTPDYISVLATLYVPQRHLRSANDNLLVVPKTQLNYGVITSTVAAARMWNKLSDIDPDLNMLFNMNDTIQYSSRYYDNCTFRTSFNKLTYIFSMLNANITGIATNLDKLKFLLDDLDRSFPIIGLTETW